MKSQTNITKKYFSSKDIAGQTKKIEVASSIETRQIMRHMTSDTKYERIN